MKKILIYGLIAALLAFIAVSMELKKSKAEQERLQSNQTALLGEVEYYKTESGKNAASVQKLTLTYDELKKNYSDICKTVKDLKIDNKRLQSVSTSATRTEVQAQTIMRDSVVIVRDSIIETIKMFRWDDAWVSIFGKLSRDSVDIDFQSRDTLVQVVHRVPHKFWFIKWGTKAIKQEIVSKNPHTKIEYTEYIELKK